MPTPRSEKRGLLHSFWPRALVGAHAHIDIAGGTDLGADMAADTAVVVGIDITSHGGIGRGGALDGILRAVDDAIATLEAHAATHATLCLGAYVVCVQAAEAFLMSFGMISCRERSL